MLITAYKCPKCKFIVYPRCKYDIRTCYCSSIKCDGTVLDSNMNEGDVILLELEVNTTTEKLAMDFYYNGTNYGLIKPEKGSK